MDADPWSKLNAGLHAEQTEHFLGGRLVEWLTAVGTIAVAASAIWLGLRQSRVQLRANADLWMKDDPEIGYTGPDTLIVSLANAGTSRITIAGVYWRIGHGPDLIAAPIGGGPWQPRIEAQDGADGGLLLSDILRVVVPTLREQGGPIRLFVRLSTGKSVECLISARAKEWLKRAAAKTSG